MTDEENEMESVEPNEAMTEEEFEGAVKAAIKDAVAYIDDYIAPYREKAEQYYRGEPFGNEEEGRSQVIMTEVKDVVLAMLPSLLRVFTSSEKPVEFAPRYAAKAAEAEQATDYVSYVFMEDNPGYSILHSSFKDALKSKTGIYKWYTADKTIVSEHTETGLVQAQIALLQQDPSIQILGFSQTGDGEIDAMTGVPTPLYTVYFRRFEKVKRQVVECLPPEEFLIARNARDLDTAEYVGHRSLKTMSDLIEMGYEREEIEEHGNSASTFQINTEAQTRNPALNNFLGGTGDSTDPSMKRYEYVESYIRIDKDGDGIAELRKVCTIGEGCYVLHDEVVDEVKLAVICPDPESHVVIGSSMADQVMDLQLIKSNIVRNTLDSLAQSIHPRTAYVEGMVNVDDLLNVETGGVIRMTQPGMVQELGSTFVGQQAMPVIAYLDDVKSSRTGISKASQGLDPDVLQSTTKAAVTATMSAAQERLEMVARNFAETGIKRLFKGLLREIIRNQDKPRTIKLRNQWVDVDPRAWDADMSVVVNVGLGNGSVEQKIQVLMAVLQKQEQIIGQYGPNNPIVSVKQYRNTLAQILELQGFKDVSKYFNEVTPEVEQKLAQPQQPAPDPTQILAQVEAQKVQKDIEIADKKMAVEIATQKATDDLQRDKLDKEIFFDAYEMSLKYGAPVDVNDLYARINANREMVQAETQQLGAPQAPMPPMGGMQ